MRTTNAKDQPAQHNTFVGSLGSSILASCIISSMYIACVRVLTRETLCLGFAKIKGIDQPAHSRLCYSPMSIISKLTIYTSEISVLASLCR